MVTQRPELAVIGIWFVMIMSGPLMVALLLPRWLRGRARWARLGGALVAAFAVVAAQMLFGARLASGNEILDDLSGAAIFFTIPSLLPLAIAVLGSLAQDGRRWQWPSTVLVVLAVSAALATALAAGPPVQWAWYSATVGCGPVRGTADWLSHPAAYVHAYRAMHYLGENPDGCRVTPCWPTCTGQWPEE
jgi:hypothetical protein